MPSNNNAAIHNAKNHLAVLKIADIIMHIFRMLQFDWPFQLAVQHIAILFRTPFKNTVNVIQIPYEFDDMKTSIAKMTQEGSYIIDDFYSSVYQWLHEVQYINDDTWDIGTIIKQQVEFLCTLIMVCKFLLNVILYMSLINVGLSMQDRRYSNMFLQEINAI